MAESGGGAEGNRRLGEVVGIDAVAPARGVVAVAVEAGDRRGGESGEAGLGENQRVGGFLIFAQTAAHQ